MSICCDPNRTRYEIPHMGSVPSPFHLSTASIFIYRRKNATENLFLFLSIIFASFGGQTTKEKNNLARELKLKLFLVWFDTCRRDPALFAYELAHQF